MLGIITATAEEYTALGKILPGAEKIKAQAGMEFLVGELNGKKVVGVQAGIGKVSAAVCTQVMIDRFSPDAIINVGVAGALNPELHVADIVISSDAAQHDFDTCFFGDSPGFISVINKIYFEADEKLMKAADEAAEALQIPHRIGRIVTGDQFICNEEKKQWLISQFQGDCTEMEGGAIAQACYMNSVPFVIIRAISDGASDGAPMQYDEFVTLAAERAMQLIEKVIEYI